MNNVSGRFKIPVVINILAVIMGLCSESPGRAGETVEQIRQRYGKPLAKNHPIFANKEASSLLELPPAQGIRLWIEYYRSQLALAESPVRAAALAQLGNQANQLILEEARTGNAAAVKKQLEKFESFAKLLDPRVYLLNDTLIQVTALEGKNGPFSLSEAYFSVERNKLEKESHVQRSSGSPSSKKMAASHQIRDWLRLGNFSYQITEANISESVIGAGKLENTTADLIAAMAGKTGANSSGDGPNADANTSAGTRFFSLSTTSFAMKATIRKRC